MTFVLRGRPEAENNNTVINTPWFNTELKMLETPFKPERRWSQSRVRSSNVRHLKISHKPSGVELKISVPAGAVVTSSLVKTALFLTSNVWNVWAARQTLQLILIWRPPESRGQKYISLTFWVERDQSGCFCRVKLHSDFRDADRNKGRVWQVDYFKTVPPFFDYLKRESGFNIH